jgi:hypothetical protein
MPVYKNEHLIQITAAGSNGLPLADLGLTDSSITLYNKITNRLFRIKGYPLLTILRFGDKIYCFDLGQAQHRTACKKLRAVETFTNPQRTTLTPAERLARQKFRDMADEIVKSRQTPRRNPAAAKRMPISAACQ